MDLLVTPNFLSVTLTEQLPLLCVNPVNLISPPSSATITLSDVKGSIVPSVYVIVYFSASNGSKNALVIPELGFKASVSYTHLTLPTT